MVNYMSRTKHDIAAHASQGKGMHDAEQNGVPFVHDICKHTKSCVLGLTMYSSGEKNKGMYYTKDEHRESPDTYKTWSTSQNAM